MHRYQHPEGIVITGSHSRCVTVIGWLVRTNKHKMVTSAHTRGRRGMIGLICRFVLQCMVTAPDVSAMGFDTSIVADLTAAVTFMHFSKGQFGSFYLLYSVVQVIRLVVKIV